MHFNNRYITLLIIFLFSTSVFPNLEYNSRIKIIHSAVLNLEFNKVNRLIKNEQKLQPDNSYLSYFFTYNLFLKSYFNSSPKDIEHFKKVSEECLESLSVEKNKNKALELSAIISIQRAYIFFLQSEHFSYVKALIKGQSYIDKINKPSIESLKIKSIYEVIGGSVPEKFKTMAKWFNIKGTPSKGIELINKYVQNSKSTSANKIEGEIIELYLKHFLDLDFSTQVKNQSVLYNYVYLKTCKLENYNKIGIIDEFENQNKVLPSYFTFLKAQYLLELQNANGLKIMDNFLKMHSNNSFRHSAHFYKSWYYCSNKDKAKFDKETKLIKNEIEPVFPSDKKSLQRAKKGSYNSALTKARMLFDAGEYLQAETILKHKNNKTILITEEEKLEFLYRLARIYEMTNRNEQALRLFQKVIDTKQSKLYFVSYSAYRSGKIYLKQGLKLKAQSYFEQALILNEGEYKTSIQQKTEFYLSLIK